MPVDRTLAERLADTIIDLYGGIENRLIADIARRLARGATVPEDSNDQLATAIAMRRFAEDLLRRLDADLTGRIEQQLALAYGQGSQAALTEFVTQAGGTVADVAAIRRALPGATAIQALAGSLASRLRGTHTRILRWQEDAFRDTVARASASVLAGTSTRLRASQVAFEDLLTKGVTGFTDAAGRNWQLMSYVEMATRTTVAQAAVQGHLDTLRAAGHAHVIVSNNPGECARCRPWEGKILAISPSAPTGPVRVEDTLTGRTITVHVAGTVAAALAAGLMHPNCRHSLSVFLPGVTTAPTNTADPLGEAQRREQRRLEREIRAAKRRAAGALTPAARTRANAEVRAWQARIRAHVERTGLPRLSHREQLPATGAREGRPAAV